MKEFMKFLLGILVAFVLTILYSLVTFNGTITTVQDNLSQILNGMVITYENGKAEYKVTDHVSKNKYKVNGSELYVKTKKDEFRFTDDGIHYNNSESMGKRNFHYRYSDKFQGKEITTKQLKEDIDNQRTHLIKLMFLRSGIIPIFLTMAVIFSVLSIPLRDISAFVAAGIYMDLKYRGNRDEEPVPARSGMRYLIKTNLEGLLLGILVGLFTLAISIFLNSGIYSFTGVFPVTVFIYFTVYIVLLVIIFTIKEHLEI